MIGRSNDISHFHIHPNVDYNSVLYTEKKISKFYEMCQNGKKKEKKNMKKTRTKTRDPTVNADLSKKHGTVSYVRAAKTFGTIRVSTTTKIVQRSTPGMSNRIWTCQQKHLWKWNRRPNANMSSMPLVFFNIRLSPLYSVLTSHHFNTNWLIDIYSGTAEGYSRTTIKDCRSVFMQMG